MTDAQHPKQHDAYEQLEQAEAGLLRYASNDVYKSGIARSEATWRLLHLEDSLGLKLFCSAKMASTPLNVVPALALLS